MAIISNTIHNNAGGSSTSVTPRTRTYRSGNTTVQLQEGQTLKGVVSDIHGNEITLSMEDGSSFTGKLPDANQYSIGQKAAFQITTLDNNTIYMKAVSNAYLLNMEDTIEQALEEANLPKSERNLEVVRSLLQNQLSISRDSILSSIRLCAQFPDSDVNAVITMKRLHMPMTPESVKQFANYQNQTHSLLNKMDNLCDSLGDMMHSVGNQVPRLSKEVGTQLINIALDSIPTKEEVALAAKVAQTASQENVSATADGTVSELVDDLSSQTEGKTTLPNGEVPPTPMEESTNPFSKMKQLFSQITDTMGKEPQTENLKSEFIHEQTGFLLSGEERQSFSTFLSEYPIPEGIKEGIAEGTVTAREFLSVIKEAFPFMTDEQAGQLIASKPFAKILKGQFLSDWTLSPEQLKDGTSLDETYDKMSRHFETLSNFNEQVLGKDIFTQVSTTASDMNENLEVMRTLNQNFQYIQLPLKLQNQNAHGDLYVMTRKEALKKDPNKLKVLLHLDMDHLGTLDIQIQKENTAISTNFYVSSKETKNLLERNMEMLSDAINKQGYAFTSELSMKEKEMDIVNDFISAEAPVGDIKRYNFDLRA